MVSVVNGNILTLNIVEGNNCIMSNTVVFCDLHEDVIKNDLMVVETGGVLRFYLSKGSMQNYILTDVKQSANHVDVHFIFTYKIGV